MPDDLPEPSPSTPEATAAVAQSREAGVTATATRLPPGFPCGVENRDYRVAPSVARQIQSLPYERQSGDPLYRPLRIFSLDPSASRLEGAEAIVRVPYEPLTRGPVGKLFEVDDYDETSGTHWGHVNLDAHSSLLNSGRSPSVADPLFHQQMVYAVGATIHASFRRALGRHVAWGFRGADGQQRLRIRPHAFEDANAYYDREKGEIAFGYFPAPENTAGRTLPKAAVFTCLSHDIVAHEVTHALLDGLRSHFADPTSGDVLGFHEGFADLVATFQHFTYQDVVTEALRRSGGKLESSQMLVGLAHEFGATLGSTKPLRTAFAEPSAGSKATDPTAIREEDLKIDGEKPQRKYHPKMEAHEMGELLVQAIFAAMLTVFRRKTAKYLRLATNGTGTLPPGEISADLQTILGESASKIAGHFLSICIRAIDYCPPVDLQIGEYLRAIITADQDLVPDDPWAYREALIDAFTARGIHPPGVTSLSEDSLRWSLPELSVKAIPRLSFANLKFEGDPARPASADELRNQARALGEIIGCPRNLRALGLARPGDPELRGDDVSIPAIQSIRSSRRIGPDGQIVFDLVAEVIQERTVRNAKGTFHLIGGSTVILGPKGEIRYVISKRITNQERCKEQAEFIRGAGKRFWKADANGVIQALANPFKLLHEPR